MSTSLRQFLDDVLEGKAIVHSRGEIELLRRIASFEELQRLAPIVEQFVEAERKERIPTPTIVSSVERILERPSEASIDQLQEVLKRATELRLSTGQIERIRTMLTKLSAERFRGDDQPNVLSEAGWKATPFGLIDRILCLY